MASNFSVISNKFFNQPRNGLDFSLNTTEYTTSIKSNAGSVVKLEQIIEVGVIVNEDETTSMQVSTLPFDATYASIKAPSINWITEGVYPGANIRIEKGGLSQNVTVLNITGGTNEKLLMSDSDMTSLISALSLSDGSSYSDLVIKVRSVPTYCKFKYKLNPLTLITPVYGSDLDDNEQAYYINSIPTTPIYGDFTFVGGQEGANMSESLEITYLSTSGNYLHRFQVNHIFKNPYYKAGELTNIQEAINPPYLAGSGTLKYDNYFEFGTPAYHNSIFQNNGLTGDVGYFEENYNGKTNRYIIENLSISNALGTGKLEATETNTVTFDVVTTGTWNIGVGAVLTHSKLPTSGEYANKTTPYDEIWIFDSIYNEESAAAVSDGIFTDFEFTIDTPTTIGVTVQIDFTTGQQSIISDTSNYAIWLGIANEDLTDPDLIDRVNLLVDVNTYSKSLDVAGLIDSYEVRFREEYKGASGTSYTSFNGGDGDLWTALWEVTVDTTKDAQILSAKMRIVGDDGVNTFDITKPITFPLGLPEVYYDGTYNYQILDVDTINSLNLPEGVVEKILSAKMYIPVSLPSTTNTGNFFTGFQVSWRDWIFNPNIPLIFFDETEPQNNRNEKTSNYSGVSGYDVYAILELSISNNIEDVPTLYQLYSSASDIIDFDAIGWTGFNGTTKLYDEDGVEVFELEDNRDLIVNIECAHSLGIISIQSLAAFVWIEIDQATATPTYLSSTFDYTSEENMLLPTDTLMTGNTQYVEIVSDTDLVTLIFKTNSANLIAGLDYNICGRLWRK